MALREGPPNNLQPLEQGYATDTVVDATANVLTNGSGF